MNFRIKPGEKSGGAIIPSSKSILHRAIICAALSGSDSAIGVNGISADVKATADCLNALGASIRTDGDTVRVSPIRVISPETKHLYCGESGSTLRFLLPVVGALNETAVFHMKGKLPSRPIDGLLNALAENGMTFRKDGDLLYSSGKLSCGEFRVPGDVSSQFISGLLFALPLIEGTSSVVTSGGLESAGYVEMTESALIKNGIVFKKTGDRYTIPGNQTYNAVSGVCERDWSGAAFFLSMGAASKKGVSVEGLSASSLQGDREILNILKEFGAKVEIDGNITTVKKEKLAGCVINAADVPDLVPAIAALAAGARGTTSIVNASRLRLKESDRIKTTVEMLRAIGATAYEKPDGIIIEGKESLEGGTVDPHNDHRIAMAAAVASSFCVNEITVRDAECVGKSFPDFWTNLSSMEAER